MGDSKIDRNGERLAEEGRKDQEIRRDLGSHLRCRLLGLERQRESQKGAHTAQRSTRSSNISYLILNRL